MSDPGTPTDPRQLRAEIEQTRAELGETVQQLAAKADVKARARQAAGEAGEKVQQRLAAVRDQAVQAAGAVTGKASAVRQQLADSDVPAPVRRPLPMVAITAAGAVVILIVVLVARRKRA